MDIDHFGGGFVAEKMEESLMPLRRATYSRLSFVGYAMAESYLSM